MSNKYEQRFFSALKDTFIGHKIKGKSGYVNLLDLKQQYFAQIEPFIKKEIDATIDEPAREELYEKLYSFFDSYLNETGTVFFANSQLHKNLYERVYSDRDDVSLFWKTQKLYYVKSEAMYDDLETEISGISYVFDASEIKHAKGNEKKSLVFYLVDVQPKKLTFKVRYQEQSKYDRLKEYLEIEKPNDIKDHLIDNYDNPIHGNVNVIKNNIDKNIFTKKGDLRDCIYCNNEEDALKTVTVEFSPSKIELIHQYCNAKTVICTEEEIKKAFHIYKKQNEVDYFIHKDAESFLKEQFDVYTYNWLFNDLKTEFDTQTVTRIQNIKRIAHKVIEYIAKFENELKAIWEKPKFVRNSNYVLTLDRLFPIKENKDDGTIVRDFENKESIDLIKKIVENKGFIEQKKEWTNLRDELKDENDKTLKKEWTEFSLFIDSNIKDFYDSEKLEKQLWKSPFDTIHFKDLKQEIISLINTINGVLDGKLIKSDNWQALNTFKTLNKSHFDLVYIDPPFNTGDDFAYKDKYQDSTWLTMMADRLELTKTILSNEGNFYLHLDYNANYLGRQLCDNTFGSNNLINEIIWGYRIQGIARNCWARKHNTILYYTKSSNNYFNQESEKVIYENSFIDTKKIKSKIESLSQKQIDEIVKGLKDKKSLPDKFKQYLFDKHYSEVKVRDVWDGDYTKPFISGSSEYIKFNTQKPEGLLYRIIKSSSPENGYVLDFYSGSGTTICTAHKLKRNWVGVEMGEHFYSKIIPRLKWTLAGNQIGISKRDDINWNGGGFFQYYELEQYEDVLAKALYQWKEKDSDVVQYSFMQDQKLLEALEIDYEKKNVKVVFEKLYPDVDIAETLSNLSGKPIKELAKDYCVLVDRETEEEMKIIYDEMTFEKYPWIKPLIWWHSK